MSQVVATRPAPPSGERGSGTVLVLGAVAVGASLALAAGLVGTAHVAAARAAGAADLAALAGAQHRVDGGSDACAHATEAARRNGAVLLACTVGARGDVTVRAGVRSPVGQAVESARAGVREPAVGEAP